MIFCGRRRSWQAAEVARWFRGAQTLGLVECIALRLQMSLPVDLARDIGRLWWRIVGADPRVPPDWFH